MEQYGVLVTGRSTRSRASSTAHEPPARDQRGDEWTPTNRQILLSG